MHPQVAVVGDGRDDQAGFVEGGDDQRVGAAVADAQDQVAEIVGARACPRREPQFQEVANRRFVAGDARPLDEAQEIVDGVGRGGRGAEEHESQTRREELHHRILLPWRRARRPFVDGHARERRASPASVNTVTAITDPAMKAPGKIASHGSVVIVDCA